MPTKWGVIGCGGIADRRTIPEGFMQSPLAELVAVQDVAEDRARAVGKKYGVAAVHLREEDLVADPDVEAVYIPLPNHLHVPWSIRAAEAGKHVLCEKPLALSAREARTLLPVRDRTHVVMGEAFMTRTHPQWRRVRELIAAGRIGELRLVTGHFSYYRRDPNDVRSKVEWGGGVLLDIGCYPVTMSRWLFGAEPLEVSAVLERDPEFRVDRLVSGLLRFPTGQAAFTVAGQAALFQQMQIFGTKGRIEIETPFNPPPDHPARILVDDGRDLVGGGVEAVTFEPVNQYTLQGDRFSEAVRGRGTVPVPLEDAIANMAVLDALFRAADTGRWERV